MVGWHHRVNGHEIERTLRDSEGEGSLAGSGLWDHKESDTTQRLNNNTSYSWSFSSKSALELQLVSERGAAVL